MSLSGFWRKLSALIRRDRFRSELDEEMAFHRAEAEKDLAASGMTPRAARRAANRQFGNPSHLKERSQEVVGFRFESVLQDLRFALRQLRQNPGFAATAILILALGIGASVAIFGFVDAALIKPLPYLQPTRLAMLFESIPLGPRFHLSYPDYLDWKRQNTSFTSLDVFASFALTLKTAEGTQQADAASVSAGFFKTLGVVPVLGRDFHPGEDAENAPVTTLLSYRAWQRRFGGRSDVLGKTVNLNGQTVTIIGVLPASFHFAPAEPADFWRILLAGNTCRGCHGLYGVARLKDGVSFASALADIKTIARQLELQYPNSNRDQVGFLLPLAEVIVGDIRPILLVLLAGASLLLLIASVNVASLLLVRSESRRREIAVRGALGASAGRLIRQFVTEGLLLAAAGGILGVSSGIEAMHLLTRLVPERILATMPYLQGLGWNLRVVVFAAGICLLTGLLFAFTPTLRISFKEMQQGLAEASRGSSSTLWRRFGVNLVAIEIATAMVLLVGAGLLGKSLYRLLHSDAGLAPDHLAMLTMQETGERYSKDEQLLAMQRQIAAKAKSLPGTLSVGFTSKLPLGDGDNTTGFVIVGGPQHREHWEVANRAVSEGYFPTLQARIVRGRNFSPDLDATKPREAIINLTLAKQYFRGQDPVGMKIAFEGSKDQMEVVGLVNDLQEGQLDAAPRAALYASIEQNPDNYFAVIVRTAQAGEAMPFTLGDAIHQIDPGVAIFDQQTMDQRIHDSPSAYLHRTSAYLVGGFAAIALLLSVVGLYGVIAYSVSQRTREIGVRMALGAPRASVYRLILFEAARLISIGLVLGLGCSLGAAVLLRKLLYGTQAWDVETLAGVAVVLAAAAMLASYIPARRAAGVNPMEALRAE